METRPTADDLVDAVRQAGAKWAALGERINKLEQDLLAARGGANRAASDLAEARQALEVSDAALQDEANRRDRAENLAAFQVRRSGNLQTKLDRTHGDLTGVSEAISRTLGLRIPG